MSLTMKGICKAFDRNLVLKSVDFDLKDGEIHALLGENGAGKSTLMNILGGVLERDAGEIAIDGAPVHFHSPVDAIRGNIAFIHQELNLINDLSVYENLFIGEEARKGIFLDRKSMKRRAREVLDSMRVDISEDTLVSTLDASYKQTVEIARALLFSARIIIMDEPTTSLNEPEIERVFDLMRHLKSQGVSIVFISHKLREVMRIADRYTVLRDGQIAGTGLVQDTTQEALARLMVGHDVSTRRLQREIKAGQEALSCSHLSFPGAFEDISFHIRKGEIVGFTGLLGDGRSELFQTVFGCQKGYKGDICLFGRRTVLRSTRQAARLGIGYVPRDRKENGIIKDLSILENGSMAIYERLSRLGLIRHAQERKSMQKQVEALKIKLASMDELITSLSGGNQQKVVLARWLSAQSRILVFDNPTQGVDVGAKEDIYSIILRLAEEGCAVAVLSSEAQEIVRLCDRAYVMYHGRISGELTGDQLTESDIMLLATGARGSAAAANTEGIVS